MRAKSLIAILLICLGTGMYVQRNGVEAVLGHGNDFAHLYLGALAVQREKNPYDGVVMRQLASLCGIKRMNPYVYPPLTAVLFMPFAQLGYRQAQLTWFLINHLLLILSLWLLLRMWDSQDRWLAWGGGAIVLASFYRITRTLTAGQLNILLLFLIALAFELERRGLRIPAGLVMGAAAVIKVYPALFILYYIGKGNWKAFTAMLLAVIVLLAFSVILTGLEASLDYFHVIREMRYGSSTWSEYGQDYQVEPSNQSPAALYYRLFTKNRGTDGFLHSPAIAMGLCWATGLLFLVALLAYLLINEGDPWEKGFALTLMTALLVPSLMWDHYLVLVLIPVAILASAIEKSGGTFRAILWAVSVAWMALPFNYWSETFKDGIGIFGMSFKLYPVLLVYLLLWISRTGERRAVNKQAESEPAG